MGRLVDADLLTKQFLIRYTERVKQGNFSFVACEIKQDFADMIEEAPTVDAVPVGQYETIKAERDSWKESCNSWKEAFAEYNEKDLVEVVHGKWVDKMVRDWHCSVCNGKPPLFDGYCRDDKPNFCPNCGAKMDLERSKDV